MNALAVTERARLVELEELVDRDLSAFVRAGNALAEIRDSRLYRETHSTFEDYCRERWNLSARHANRTIEAAQVAAVVGPTGPTNEAQARELAPVLREHGERAAREAWDRATAAAQNGKPTAAAVRDAAAAVDREQIAAELPEAARLKLDDERVLVLLEKAIAAVAPVRIAQGRVVAALARADRETLERLAPECSALSQVLSELAVEARRAASPTLRRVQ